MPRKYGSTNCEKCGGHTKPGTRSSSGVVYTCQDCGYKFRRRGGVNMPYNPLSGWQEQNPVGAKRPARSKIQQWVSRQGFNARYGEPFEKYNEWLEQND